MQKTAIEKVQAERERARRWRESAKGAAWKVKNATDMKAARAELRANKEGK